MGSTGFNLEHAITSHVQMIKAEGSTTNSDDAELKAHLYDACEDLVRKGLTEEEAFMVARNRLGDMDLLVEEYGKVNTTVSTNRIWAYLLIGAGLIPGVYQAIFYTSGAFNLFMFNYFNKSSISILSVTLFNFSLIVLIGYIVKKKQNISRFLEGRIAKNAVVIVLLSYIPLAITGIIPHKTKDTLVSAFNFPIREFDSRTAEISLCLLILSGVVGLLCLLFSLKKTEHLTVKSLFEKPSVSFLLLYGLVIEVLASFTRGIYYLDIMWIRAVFFGMVYLFGALIIAYHNPRGKALEYLLIFSVVGFCLEVLGGWNLHRNENDWFMPFYFASGIVLGVLFGALLGSKLQKKAITD